MFPSIVMYFLVRMEQLNINNNRDQKVATFLSQLPNFVIILKTKYQISGVMNIGI